LHLRTFAPCHSDSIFVLTNTWPRNESYSLTDQIRRASRFSGANLAEAWARRRHPAQFLNKSTGAEGELQETTHWLDTATACRYWPLQTSSHCRGDLRKPAACSAA